MKNNMIHNYLKIARFDHWIKQLFVLPGTWLAFAMVKPDTLSTKTPKLLPNKKVGLSL